jgi:glycosyltransferase involved in cell wall biosynthesis
MANVALFIFGITELKGGGGAERFFADFFDIYNQKVTAHKLYYLLDKGSVANLNKVGKLSETRNILKFKIFSNRFKDTLEFFQIVKYIITKGIKIIHIPLYSVSYIPLIKKLNGLPSFLKPKIVINIVNCYVPFAIKDEKHESHKGMKNTYQPLFNTVNVDGYFCWNQNFVDYINNENVYPEKSKPLLYAISSRFSDVKKFFPAEKKNTIVFAARLDNQKHPQWFVEAVNDLKKQNPELISKWKFILSGNGPLRESLIEYADKNGLKENIEFVIEGDLSGLLNSSKAYVSCQDYDNFPSLAMAEAMAAGNAIIARNVGQTGLFVKHKQNGLVLEKDSPEGLANAMKYYIENDSMHAAMANESVRLMKEVHTADNFIKQIDEYWTKILEQKN